ncbi:F-box/FBD/LRR-repeat protein At1g13570-like [Vicia villosa]|uniref:F-box/FBD/LRR-repeat protein At1g13570-like n=1 Tax=Vicia villosa TaxID=3911 RepID=UPI00273B88B2|nr:F-box/FBD/LRR-repeat protein At1g13570-like [Vicia villosa]
MSDALGPDLISDLPDGIIETILIHLPIRDATRTSILSTRWRNIWCSISHLVFDEKSFPISVGNGHGQGRQLLHERVVKFISKVLLVHQGPIHKFQITHRSLLTFLEMDEWILFLSRNGVKDLTLDFGVYEFFIMPTCLFDCEKLTRLELSRCELYPPVSFKGFVNLKRLDLNQVLISSKAIERLVSTCPLLECLSLKRCDCLALTISAPKLKYVHLYGEFKDICLVDMPLLVELFVSMYMPHDDLDLEQSSNCNFVKFLSGVPNLKRLDGFVHFTKYLSIGNDPRHHAMMYNNLECIQMGPVSFKDKKEILVVLRLIRSSPNLKELHISGMSDIQVSTYTEDLDFWEKEYPSDSILSKLKVVELKEMSGVPCEIEFIKFLLGSSPVLEKMFIIPYIGNREYLLQMSAKLMEFRKASTKAEIYFTCPVYPIRVSPGFRD